MSEIDRFSQDTESTCRLWSETGHLSRSLKRGRHHLADLSLSDTVILLDELDIERSPIAINNWVPKADLQPTEGRSPNHVPIDETVIRIDDYQYWLYAAVDSDPGEFLHVRLFPTSNSGVASVFLGELTQKPDVEDAEFLVNGTPWLHAALHRHDRRFHHVTHGNRNAIERVFKEIKRRTEQSATHFRHADPDTAESWH